MVLTSRRIALFFTMTVSTGMSRTPWSRLSNLAFKSPPAVLLILKTSRSLTEPTSSVPFQLPVASLVAALKARTGDSNPMAARSDIAFFIGVLSLGCLEGINRTLLFGQLEPIAELALRLLAIDSLFEQIRQRGG